jgi:hypothetical protein
MDNSNLSPLGKKGLLPLFGLCQMTLHQETLFRNTILCYCMWKLVETEHARHPYSRTAEVTNLMLMRKGCCFDVAGTKKPAALSNTAGLFYDSELLMSISPSTLKHNLDYR